MTDTDIRRFLSDQSLEASKLERLLWAVGKLVESEYERKADNDKLMCTIITLNELAHDLASEIELSLDRREGYELTADKDRRNPDRPAAVDAA